MQKLNTLIVGIVFLVSNIFSMNNLSKNRPDLIKRKKTIQKKTFYENVYTVQISNYIESSDLESLQRKLKNNELFFCTYPKISLAALIKAVECNTDKCLEFLLKNKADPNAVRGDGNSPLFFVKDAKCAQKLIEYSALLEHKNKQQETALLAIIKRSSTQDKKLFDTVHAVLKTGANVNVKNINGDTPLHWAVYKKNIPIIRLLLFYGGDRYLSNNQGLTSYKIAKKDKESIVGFNEYDNIIDSVGEFEIDDMSFNVLNVLVNDGSYLKDFFRVDCFGYCFSEIKIMENLLRNRFSKVWSFLESDYSPYSKATVDMAKFIANRSSLRCQFLQFLCNQDFCIARVFLSCYPYILHTYQGEDTADTINGEFIKQFFKISPNLNCCLYDGIKKLLYEGCFNINVIDDQGTPLLSLLIKDPKDTIKYYDVLKNGARVNAKDRAGKTALWHALLLKDDEKITRLLQYGAVVCSDMFSDEDSKIGQIYAEQKCFNCKFHPVDMSNIPCINRHIGHFICKCCYDEEISGRCPLCRRVLDSYGM